MYSIALILGYLYRIEKLVLTDQEFIRGMSQYHDRLKLKTQEFPTWIDDELNPKIRIEYYRYWVEDRLNKLDRHAKDQWKIDYSKCIKENIPQEQFKFSDEKSHKYFIKRFRLEQLILP